MLLLAAALFPRYVTQPGPYLAQFWQRVQLWWDLEPLAALDADFMEMDALADGGLLLVSKYAVLRQYPDGRRERLLTPAQARAATGVRVGAFATAELADDASLWVGGWHGELLQQGAEGIRLWSLRDQAPRGRIRDLTYHRGAVYFGGDGGLWRLADGAAQGQRLDDGGLRLRALRVDGPRLWVAGRDRLLHWDDQQLVEHWRRGPGDGALESLHLGEAGRLWLGTRDGLLVLEADGRERARLLPGEQVRSLARDADGGLWVATWQSGVAVPIADGWRRFGFAAGLPGDSVADLAIDARGDLWLGIYGEGGYRIAATRLQAMARDWRAPVIDPDQRIHADACRAALAELAPGEGASGQVTLVADTAGPRVFFAGRQVCPRGIGHYVGPGTWGAVGEAGLRGAEAGQHWQRGLPDGVAAAMVTAMHRDQGGRWWLGTRHLGVFEARPDGWQAHGSVAGLAGNPIQAIDSDVRGVWVASYPPSGSGRSAGALAGLHHYDGQHWRSLRPRSGRRAGMLDPLRGSFRDLASAQSNDLRVLADGGVLVATNGGLSLVRGPDDIQSFDRYDLGMPSNFVDRIGIDDQGRWWLTHAYWGPGVTWRAGPVFRNRNSRDGLFADSLLALAHDGRGRVWLQASDGRVGVYHRDRLMH